MLTDILHNDNVCNVDNQSTQNIVGKEDITLVDTQLLEEFIRRSGKKKTYLAEQLQISVQSLKRKIDNKSVFGSDEVAILCRELGITKLTDKEKIFFKM